jgi:hypothetical protein
VGEDLEGGHGILNALYQHSFEETEENHKFSQDTAVKPGNFFTTSLGHYTYAYPSGVCINTRKM